MIDFAPFLIACGNTNQPSENESAPLDGNQTAETEDMTDMKMNVTIGEQSFIATLEDNAATRELVKMMEEAPISIKMDDLSGWEDALGDGNVTAEFSLAFDFT